MTTNISDEDKKRRLAADLQLLDQFRAAENTAKKAKEEESNALAEIRRKKAEEIRARRDKNNQALRAAMSKEERKKDDATTKRNSIEDASVGVKPQEDRYAEEQRANKNRERNPDYDSDLAFAKKRLKRAEADYSGLDNSVVDTIGATAGGAVQAIGSTADAILSMSNAALGRGTKEVMTGEVDSQTTWASDLLSPLTNRLGHRAELAQEVLTAMDNEHKLEYGDASLSPSDVAKIKLSIKQQATVYNEAILNKDRASADKALETVNQLRDLLNNPDVAGVGVAKYADFLKNHPAGAVLDPIVSEGGEELAQMLMTRGLLKGVGGPLTKAKIIGADAITGSGETVGAYYDSRDTVTRNLTRENALRAAEGKPMMSREEIKNRAMASGLAAASADVVAGAVFSGVERKLLGEGVDDSTSIIKNTLTGAAGEAAEEVSSSTGAAAFENLMSGHAASLGLGRDALQSAIVGGGVGGTLKGGGEAARQGTDAVAAYSAIRGQEVDVDAMAKLQESAKMGAAAADGTLSRSSAPKDSYRDLVHSLTDSRESKSSDILKSTVDDMYKKNLKTMSEITGLPEDSPEVVSAALKDMQLKINAESKQNRPELNDPADMFISERADLINQTLDKTTGTDALKDTALEKHKEEVSRKVRKVESSGDEAADSINKKAVLELGLPVEVVNNTQEGQDTSAKLLDNIKKYNEKTGKSLTLSTLTNSDAVAMDQLLSTNINKPTKINATNKFLYDKFKLTTEQSQPGVTRSSVKATEQSAGDSSALSDIEGAMDIAGFKNKVSRRKAARIALSIARSTSPISKGVIKGIKSKKLRVASFDDAGDKAKKAFGTGSKGEANAFYTNGTIYLNTDKVKDSNDLQSFLDHELDHMFRYDDGLANIDTLYGFRDGDEKSTVEQRKSNVTSSLLSTVDKAFTKLDNKNSKDLTADELASVKAYSAVMNTEAAKDLEKKLGRELTFDDMRDSKYEKALGGELVAYYLQYKRELFKRGLSKDYLSDMGGSKGSLLSEISTATLKSIAGSDESKKYKVLANNLLAGRLAKMSDSSLTSTSGISRSLSSEAFNVAAAESNEEADVTVLNRSSSLMLAIQKHLVDSMVTSTMPEILRVLAGMDEFDLKQRNYFVKSVQDYLKAMENGESAPKLPANIRETFGTNFSPVLENTIKTLSLDLMASPYVSIDVKKVTTEVLADAAMSIFRGLGIDYKELSKRDPKTRFPLLISLDIPTNNTKEATWLRGILDYAGEIPTIMEEDETFDTDGVTVSTKGIEKHSTAKEIDEKSLENARTYAEQSINSTNDKVIDFLVKNITNEVIAKAVIRAVSFTNRANDNGKKKRLQSYGRLGEHITAEDLKAMSRKDLANTIKGAIHYGFLHGGAKTHKDQNVDSAVRTLDVLNSMGALFSLSTITDAVEADNGNLPRDERSSGTLNTRTNMDSSAPILANQYMEAGKISPISVPGLRPDVTLFASSSQMMAKNKKGGYDVIILDHSEILAVPRFAPQTMVPSINQVDGTIDPSHNPTPFLYLPMNSLVPQLSISNGFTEFGQVTLSNKTLYSSYNPAEIRQWALNTTKSGSEQLSELLLGSIRSWLFQMPLKNKMTVADTPDSGGRSLLLTDKLEKILAGTILEKHIPEIVALVAPKATFNFDSPLANDIYKGLKASMAESATYEATGKFMWPSWVKIMGLHARRNQDRIGNAARSFLNAKLAIDILEDSSISDDKVLNQINLLGWVKSEVNPIEDAVITDNMMRYIKTALMSDTNELVIGKVTIGEPYVNPETGVYEPMFSKRLPKDVDRRNYVAIRPKDRSYRVVYVHNTALLQMYGILIGDTNTSSLLIDDNNESLDRTMSDDVWEDNGNFSYNEDIDLSFEESGSVATEATSTLFQNFLGSMAMVNEHNDNSFSISPASKDNTIRTYFPETTDSSSIRDYNKSITSMQKYKLTREDKDAIEERKAQAEELEEYRDAVEKQLTGSVDSRSMYAVLSAEGIDQAYIESRKAYRTAFRKTSALNLEMYGDRSANWDIAPNKDDVLWSSGDVAIASIGLDVPYELQGPQDDNVQFALNSIYQAFSDNRPAEGANLKEDDFDPFTPENILKNNPVSSYSPDFEKYLKDMYQISKERQARYKDNLQSRAYKAELKAEENANDAYLASLVKPGLIHPRQVMEAWSVIHAKELKKTEFLAKFNAQRTKEKEGKQAKKDEITKAIALLSPKKQAELEDANVAFAAAWNNTINSDVGADEYRLVYSGNIFKLRIDKLSGESALRILKTGVLSEIYVPISWKNEDGTTSEQLVDCRDILKQKFYRGLVPNIGENQTSLDYYNNLQSSYDPTMLDAIMLPGGYEYASLLGFVRSSPEELGVGKSLAEFLYKTDPEMFARIVTKGNNTLNDDDGNPYVIGTTVAVNWGASDTNTAKRTVEGMKSLEGQFAPATGNTILDPFFAALSPTPLVYLGDANGRYSAETLTNNAQTVRDRLLDAMYEAPSISYIEPFATPEEAIKAARDVFEQEGMDWDSVSDNFILRAELPVGVPGKDNKVQWSFVEKKGLVKSLITKDSLKTDYESSEDKNHFHIPNPFDTGSAEYNDFRISNDTWVGELTNVVNGLSESIAIGGNIASGTDFLVSMTDFDVKLDRLNNEESLRLKQLVSSTFVVPSAYAAETIIRSDNRTFFGDNMPKSYETRRANVLRARLTKTIERKERRERRAKIEVINNPISRSSSRIRPVSGLDRLLSSWKQSIKGTSLPDAGIADLLGAAAFAEKSLHSLDVSSRKFRKALNELKYRNPTLANAVLADLRRVDEAGSMAGFEHRVIRELSKLSLGNKGLDVATASAIHTHYFAMRNANVAMADFAIEALKNSKDLGNKDKAISLAKERIARALRRGIAFDISIVHSPGSINAGTPSADNLPNNASKPFQATFKKLRKAIEGYSSGNPSDPVRKVLDDGIAAFTILIDGAATDKMNDVVKKEYDAYKAATDKEAFIRELLLNFYTITEAHKNTTPGKDSKLLAYVTYVARDAKDTATKQTARVLLGSRISPVQTALALRQHLAEELLRVASYVAAGHTVDEDYAIDVPEDLQKSNPLFSGGALLDVKTADQLQTELQNLNKVAGEGGALSRGLKFVLRFFEKLRLFKIAFNPMLQLAAIMSSTTLATSAGANPKDWAMAIAGFKDYILHKDTKGATEFIDATGLSASQSGRSEMMNAIGLLIQEHSDLKKDFDGLGEGSTVEDFISFISNLVSVITGNATNEPSKQDYYVSMGLTLSLGAVESVGRHAAFRGVMRTLTAKNGSRPSMNEARALLSKIYPTLNKTFFREDSTSKLLYIYLQYFITVAVATANNLLYNIKNIIDGIRKFKPGLAVRSAANLTILVSSIMYSGDYAADGIKNVYERATGVNQAPAKGNDLVIEYKQDGTPVLISIAGLDPAGPIVKGVSDLTQTYVLHALGKITAPEHAINASRALEAMAGSIIQNPISAELDKESLGSMSGAEAYMYRVYQATTPTRSKAIGAAEQMFLDEDIPTAINIATMVFNARPYALTQEASLLYDDAGIATVAYSDGYIDKVQEGWSVSGIKSTMYGTTGNSIAYRDDVTNRLRYYQYVQAINLVELIEVSKLDTPYGNKVRQDLMDYQTNTAKRKYYEVITRLMAQYGDALPVLLHKHLIKNGTGSLPYDYNLKSKFIPDLAGENTPEAEMEKRAADSLSDDKLQALADAFYNVQSSYMYLGKAGNNFLPVDVDPLTFNPNDSYTFDSKEHFLQLKTATYDKPVVIVDNQFTIELWLNDPDTLGVRLKTKGMYPTEYKYRMTGYDASESKVYPEKGGSYPDTKTSEAKDRLLDRLVAGMTGPITMHIAYQSKFEELKPLGKIPSVTKGEAALRGSTTAEIRKEVKPNMPLILKPDKPELDKRGRVLGTLFVEGVDEKSPANKPTVIFRNIYTEAVNMNISRQGTQLPQRARANKDRVDEKKNKVSYNNSPAIKYAEKWVPEGLDATIKISNYDALELATELTKDLPLGISVEAKGSSAPVFKRGNRIIVNSDKFTTRRDLANNILRVTKSGGTTQV